MAQFEQNLLDLLLPSEEKIEIFLASRGIKGSLIEIPDSYAMELVKELLPELGLYFRTKDTRSGWKIYLTKYKEDLKIPDLFLQTKEGTEARKNFYRIADCCVDAFLRGKSFNYPTLFPYVSYKYCSHLCSETRRLNDEIRREIFKEFGLRGLFAFLLDKFGNRLDFWPYKIKRLLRDQRIGGKLKHHLEVDKFNPEPVYGRSRWDLDRRNETIVYTAFLRKTGRRIFGDSGRSFKCIYDSVGVIVKPPEYVEPLSQIAVIRT